MTTRLHLPLLSAVLAGCATTPPVTVAPFTPPAADRTAAVARALAKRKARRGPGPAIICFSGCGNQGEGATMKSDQEREDIRLFAEQTARNGTPEARKRDLEWERQGQDLRAETWRCRVRSGTPDYEGVL